MPGLYGAFNSAVSGITAQSSKVGEIGNNIANVNTVGFKDSVAYFSSLVTGSANSGGGGAGVFTLTRANVDRQGTLENTNVVTDMAVSGKGMFVVQDAADDTGSTFYTRAASFREDENGNFVNAAGYYLMGWRLDNQGRLPGQPGNTSNTTSFNQLESLSVVNVRGLTSQPVVTENFTLAANLNAAEDPYKGATLTTLFPASSPNNSIGAGRIIIPNAGLAAGDALVLDTGLGGATTFTYGGFEVGDANAAYSVSNADQNLTAAPGDTLTIQINGTGTVYTFSYVTSAPNTSTGQFRSLNDLASAINAVAGLNARVVGTDIYIGSDSANDGLTFGGTNVATDFGFTTYAAGVNRFNTLQQLADLINLQPDIGAEITNPTVASQVKISVNNPLDTLILAAGTDAGLAVEFGFPSVPTTVAASYKADTSASNMASGAIAAHFTRAFSVYDSLGDRHDMRLSFLKTATNQWSVEFYAANPSEITQVTGTVDGQVATGTITFNGDGTLQSISPSLKDALAIAWTNGAVPSAITLNLGTEGAVGSGLADGLRQYEGPYQVQTAEQDGAPFGQLSSINISSEGKIVALFDNGESREVFQVPLATFPNANGLAAGTGNIYSQTSESGEFLLNLAGGFGGIGKIVSSALEQSTVDIAKQLTDMIIAQRSYQANAKTITTSDKMLETLTDRLS